MAAHWVSGSVVRELNPHPFHPFAFTVFIGSGAMFVAVIDSFARAEELWHETNIIDAEVVHMVGGYRR
jgi:hypothetical protein